MPHKLGRTIMIVEDNDDDFEATERALRAGTETQNTVHRCKDGMEAWNYLQDDANAKPALILLDLNMPGLDGRKLLKKIREDEATRRIPVIVLSTSSSEDDVDTCYDFGANTYLRKPIAWGDFSEAIARLQRYWFKLALLPR